MFERNLVVGKTCIDGVGEELWSKKSLAYICCTRDLNHRWRVERYVCERSAKIESIEKNFQIQAAAHLKINAVALPAPIGTPGKTAAAIVPFAVRDIQMLVAPFGSGRQASHFVIASLQPVSAQCCLDPRILEFCNVSAKFYLQ